MASSRPYVLFLMLLVPCLTACALLSTGRDLPLIEFNCQQAFPRGYEVRATLRLAPAEQDFLLALATTSERIDLALLTVQGMPVYDFSCTDGDSLASVQMPAADDLPPLALLNYLGMIYMDANALSQQLQPGWAVQAHGAERILTGPDTAVGVQISYQGDAPWFSAIELADSLNGITLRITILESSHVLPE